MNPYVIPSIALIILTLLTGAVGYGFFKAKTNLGKLFSGTIAVLLLLLACASGFVLVSDQAKVQLGLIKRNTEIVNPKNPKKFVAKDDLPEEVATGVDAPEKKDKAFWMAKAKAALAQKGKNPRESDLLSSVNEQNDSVSVWLITATESGNANNSRDIYLKFPEIADAEKAPILQQMAMFITHTAYNPRPTGRIKAWKNINLVFLGKKSATGPTEVLQVTQIYKEAGKLLKIQENYVDPEFSPTPPGRNYKDIKYLAQLKETIEGASPDNVDAVSYSPSNPRSNVNVEFTLPPNGEKAQKGKFLKAELEKIRTTLLETYKYIPGVNITVKETGKIVLVAQINRSNLDKKETHGIRLLAGDPEIVEAFDPAQSKKMQAQKKQREYANRAKAVKEALERQKAGAPGANPQNPGNPQKPAPKAPAPPPKKAAPLPPGPASTVETKPNP